MRAHFSLTSAVANQQSTRLAALELRWHALSDGQLTARHHGRPLGGHHHSMNMDDRVVIRLVGGPADGFVFTRPADKMPVFIGVGNPVARYESKTGTAMCASFAT